MKTLSSLQRFILITGVLLTVLEPAAQARKARKSSCGENMAKTSTYFVPKLSDYCKDGKVCDAFKRAVTMEGAGLLPDNKVLEWAGRDKKTRKHQFTAKDRSDCPTGARGAWGDCLMPFLSVAAQTGKNGPYQKGDIIALPALKGKQLRMPDGRIMTHPGFVIVQDIGEAIRGSRRFDFFVGTYRETDRNNPFGGHGAFDMSDKNSCESYKQFSVIRAPRKSRTPDDTYANALAAIESAFSGASQPTNVRMASLNTGGDDGGIH